MCRLAKHVGHDIRRRWRLEQTATVRTRSAASGGRIVDPIKAVTERFSGTPPDPILPLAVRDNLHIRPGWSITPEELLAFIDQPSSDGGRERNSLRRRTAKRSTGREPRMVQASVQECR
jgi:hypothetical protein